MNKLLINPLAVNWKAWINVMICKLVNASSWINSMISRCLVNQFYVETKRILWYYVHIGSIMSREMDNDVPNNDVTDPRKLLLYLMSLLKYICLAWDIQSNNCFFLLLPNKISLFLVAMLNTLFSLVISLSFNVHDNRQSILWMELGLIWPQP